MEQIGRYGKYMTDNPKVSIIIPVYNGSNYMRNAINSAINQTYKNIEIIVVNDGSKDNTDKIAKSYGNKIKYICKENGGVATALNLGIRAASGDYIAWLSHDDLYYPEKTEKEIDVIKKLDNKKTIIFSNFELMDEKENTIVRTDLLQGMEREKFCQGIYPVLRGSVNGDTILIPKECFNEIGYFNEEQITTNDYEMWIRLFSKYPSYFIEDALIKYRIHPNQDTNKSPVYIAESNRLWKDIINSVSAEQIKKWEFDVFNVYMTLFIQMKNSRFYEAAKLAYKKAKEIYLKSTPRVSIAMPCYNSSKYIDKAIESILEQTFCNFELIIVDDNSTDNTMQKVEVYSKNDFRIKVLKNIYEKGVSGAMNTAIEYSSGEYFTRMDSDDISVLNRIEKQVNFLDNNKNYSICSVNISMIDKFGNIYNEAVYPDTEVPHEWNFIWTNSIPNAPCMYRTNIIKDNKNKFDKNLKTAEDYDFLTRVIIDNKAYMIPEALYLYRYISNSLYNSNLSETFKISLEIGEKYLSKISKIEVPEYYPNLTCFQNEDLKVYVEEIKCVNRYLMQLANELKIFFKWNEKEHDLVVDSIPEILERYVLAKNKVQQNNVQIGQGTFFGSIKRLIIRTIVFLKKNGLKKTLKKIVNKLTKKKIKVLEVNNIDLPGRRFNGYDLINDTKNSNEIDIKQAVIYKQSNNENVKKILKNNKQMEMFYKLIKFEEELSIHSNLSITTPALLNLQSYKKSDIVHFHMFHNSKFSLASLIKICNEKKVVLSIHDPWIFTGRCVHFDECEKWKTGCEKCDKLSTLFEFKEDNCNSLWNLKKEIFKQINPDVIVSSKYMYDLVKQSPITRDLMNVHFIPLGIDLNFFNNKIGKIKSRAKLNIPYDHIVLFLRAQDAFKGTRYIVQALRKLNIKEKITILTCDEEGHFKGLESRYNIIDMGMMDSETLLYAYNACDIFLMPSTGETFGMMAVEAMACSKPVIIFDNTATPFVTYAPECGFLVENKNVDKLKEAIEFLIRNPQEREKRGILGRKICEKHYDASDYTNNILNLYKQIEERPLNRIKNQVLNKKIINNEDVNKIKSRLNVFTKQNFKQNTRKYKKIYYYDIEEKQDSKINYADIEVQKIIAEYNRKIYDAIPKKSTNKFSTQTKNAINLLIKDRTRLKHSIQYKIQQIFSKKD